MESQSSNSVDSFSEDTAAESAYGSAASHSEGMVPLGSSSSSSSGDDDDDESSASSNESAGVGLLALAVGLLPPADHAVEPLPPADPAVEPLPPADPAVEPPPSPENTYGPFMLRSPLIDFDENLFKDKERIRQLCIDGRHLEAERVKEAGRAAFVAHTRWFVEHYEEPKVYLFRLCFSNPTEHEADVNNWIEVAAARAVEVLDLDFSNPEHHAKYPEGRMGYFELRPEVYRLRDSIHTVRLSGCNFDPSKFARLGSLRKVSIERVQFGSEALEVLIACCEQLEELILKKLDLLTGVRIVDTRQLLTRLTIEDCLPMEAGIEIAASRLKYFKYSGFMVPFTAHNLRTLDEADLDFKAEYELAHQGNLLCHFLSCLGNARVLSVCSYLTRVITSGVNKSHMPLFTYQLRSLTLKNATLQSDESVGIVFLLQSYPMLESLRVEMGYRTELTPIFLVDDMSVPFDVKAFWAAQESPIFCLERYLREVHVVHFRGHENEIQFLKFLLKKAGRLENLYVGIAKETSFDWECFEINTSAARDLHLLWKASPNVNIVIG